MESDILEQYFIIASLLMPAIIMITIRRWITPINCNFFQDIYKFVGYGMFNFAIFVLLIIPKFNLDLENDVFNLKNISQNPLPFLDFAIFLPIILGVLLSIIDKLQIMNFVFKFIFRKDIETNGLTAWEEFFAQNIKGKIQVILDDNTKIVGDFTKPSRASSSVQYKDVWINKVDNINGVESEPHQAIWVNGKNIKYITIERKSTVKWWKRIIDLLANIFKAAGINYVELCEIKKKLDGICKILAKKGEKNDNKSKSNPKTNKKTRIKK